MISYTGNKFRKIVSPGNILTILTKLLILKSRKILNGFNRTHLVRSKSRDLITYNYTVNFSEITDYQINILMVKR